MSELPPPGSDSEEEEQEHEEEAGADVQNHTQTHVHAVEAQTQNPHATTCTAQNLLLLLAPRSRLSGSRLRLLLGPALRHLLRSSSCSALRPLLAGQNQIRGRSREAWGGQGVSGGQVGGAVVTLEEMQDVGVVPHMDAVLLLVAGGAEGGAWPRSFGEEGVIAQGAWRRRRRRNSHQLQNVQTQ